MFVFSSWPSKAFITFSCSFIPSVRSVSLPEVTKLSNFSFSPRNLKNAVVKRPKPVAIATNGIALRAIVAIPPAFATTNKPVLTSGNAIATPFAARAIAVNTAAVLPSGDLKRLSAAVIKAVKPLVAAIKAGSNA